MGELDSFRRAILADPDDRLTQLIYADWLDEHGRPTQAHWLRSGPPHPKTYRYGDGDGGFDGGYGDGDGGYGDGDGGGYGDGGYGDGDGGYGGGDGGFGGDGDKTNLTEGIFMDDGLHLIVTPGGYSPYVVVAWVRVRDGWLHYLPGHRTVRRFGTSAQLSRLASHGPVSTTQLLDPSELGGGCSAGSVCRFEVCDPAAWAGHCPKPKGWDDA